jgi:hypothetical protein
MPVDQEYDFISEGNQARGANDSGSGGWAKRKMRMCIVADRSYVYRYQCSPQLSIGIQQLEPVFTIAVSLLRDCSARSLLLISLALPSGFSLPPVRGSTYDSATGLHTQSA